MHFIRHKILFPLLLILGVGRFYAEVIPANNSLINYTTIYFEENFFETATRYEICIYRDSLGVSDSALKKISNSVPAFWIKDLNWATVYAWRVRAFDKENKELNSGALHTFRILKYTSSRYSEIRLNIKTNKSNKQSGGLICPDYARTIFNRKGEAVWTFPFIENLVNDDSQIRNLLVTKENTLTFLTEKLPLEIDFNGKVLWQAPFPFVLNGDTIGYHHDFKKTNRGTYMVLGNKKSYRKLLGEHKAENLNNEFGIKKIDGVFYRQTETGLLLEFNREDELIWFWDAGDYLQDVDLNYKKAQNGLPNMSSHVNAFNENEEGTKIYISFRDFSRLIKIDKKTKKVELSYGEKFPSGDAKFANSAFRTQHDANVTKHNSILIFNNNGARSGGPSSVEELRDNITSKDSAVIWKFNLDFDTLSNGKSLRGGNVVELPNSNLLVCAGALNRIFEVTKNKEIVWDAFVESKAKSDTAWLAFPQYRANWTDCLSEYHFLARINSFEVHKNEMKFNLVINNTGNTADDYKIEVLDTKNSVLYKTSIKTLEQNQELNKTVSVTLKDVTLNEFNIKVISGHKNSVFINFLRKKD